MNLTSSSLLTLGVLNLTLVYFLIFYGNQGLYGENGLLENIQAILLALGTFLFLAPPQYNAYSSLRYALALLCFSFLLRELDVEQMDIPVILQALGSGRGKRVLLLLLWGVVCWRAYQELHHELLEPRAITLAYVNAVCVRLPVSVGEIGKRLLDERQVATTRRCP